MTADVHRPGEGVKIVGNAVPPRVSYTQGEMCQNAVREDSYNTRTKTQRKERERAGRLRQAQRERTNERTGDTADAKAVSRLARRTQAHA